MFPELVTVPPVSERSLALASTIAANGLAFLATAARLPPLELSEAHLDHALETVARHAPFAALRFASCPSRVADERFWNLYFTLLASDTARRRVDAAARQLRRSQSRELSQSPASFDAVLAAVASGTPLAAGRAGSASDVAAGCDGRVSDGASAGLSPDPSDPESDLSRAASAAAASSADRPAALSCVLGVAEATGVGEAAANEANAEVGDIASGGDDDDDRTAALARRVQAVTARLARDVRGTVASLFAALDAPIGGTERNTSQQHDPPGLVDHDHSDGENDSDDTHRSFVIAPVADDPFTESGLSGGSRPHWGSSGWLAGAAAGRVNATNPTSLRSNAAADESATDARAGDDALPALAPASIGNLLSTWWGVVAENTEPTTAMTEHRTDGGGADAAAAVEEPTVPPATHGSGGGGWAEAIAAAASGAGAAAASEWTHVLRLVRWWDSDGADGCERFGGSRARSGVSGRDENDAAASPPRATEAALASPNGRRSSGSSDDRFEWYF